jgi:hypothetical protein
MLIVGVKFLILAQSHDLGSTAASPMVRKRKRAPLAQELPKHTALTLKEYIWTELLLVLRKHSFVSLTGKRPSDKALGNFW